MGLAWEVLALCVQIESCGRAFVASGRSTQTVAAMEPCSTLQAFQMGRLEFIRLSSGTKPFELCLQNFDGYEAF